MSSRITRRVGDTVKDVSDDTPRKGRNVNSHSSIAAAAGHVQQLAGLRPPKTRVNSEWNGIATNTTSRSAGCQYESKNSLGYMSCAA